MINPPNSTEQALEDYFKDLLSGESAPLKETLAAAPPKPAVRDMFSARAAVANSARITLRAPPPSSAANVSMPLRVYAEPIKTLNLRMPLPALAPAPVAAIDKIDPIVVVEMAPALKASPQPLPAITSEEPPPTSVVPVAASTAEETDQPAAHAPAAWLANGRPAWAQQPFECLLFKVGGLALAAPLAELGSIYAFDADLLTTIFGQAAWFMGLLPVKGYNVRAIDAAQVVMPERYAATMRADYRYVITLHGSDWGLAVDAVADSVVLQPDDIRWRGQRGKRPWLAGTVVQQMCALLDVAQLVWMFQNQDGKRMTPPA